MPLPCPLALVLNNSDWSCKGLSSTEEEIQESEHHHAREHHWTPVERVRLEFRPSRQDDERQRK